MMRARTPKPPTTSTPAPGLHADDAGVTGSDISELGGLITPADIASGSINHALRYATTINAPSFVSPANRSDGSTPGGIPDGEMMRLDPSLDLSQSSTSPPTSSWSPRHSKPTAPTTATPPAPSSSSPLSCTGGAPTPAPRLGLPLERRQPPRVRHHHLRRRRAQHKQQPRHRLQPTAVTSRPKRAKRGVCSAVGQTDSPPFVGRVCEPGRGGMWRGGEVASMLAGQGQPDVRPSVGATHVTSGESGLSSAA